MREHKYRAWDAIKKEMVYNVGISPGGMPIKNGYSWFNPESTSLTIDIMEYAGLKDKAGNEIYRSDQIKGEGCGFRTTSSEVYFNCNGAYITIGDHEILLSRFSELEIIGNIYEHNHLSEKEA